MLLLKLQTGIELASGKFFAGIMGSLRREAFASAGMPANIAVRLQGLARSGQILLNEATYRAICPKAAAESLPAVRNKGLEGPFVIIASRCRGTSI